MLDVLVPAKRLTFYWRTIKRLMSDVFLELWLCGVKSWPPDWPLKMLEQHTKRSWCQWPNSVAAMSCLWTFGFWAIWEWVGAVKFESPKSNGVAYVFPIWYHSLTHQESQAQTHAGISAFNIDLWVDWSPTFLPHSAGIWWSFEGWIWWSFPDLDQRHQWISYCLKAPMWDCWRWKIWRWGQLRSPHDSGKKIWPGYVCSSMLTRTNIRII